MDSLDGPDLQGKRSELNLLVQSGLDKCFFF